MIVYGEAHGPSSFANVSSYSGQILLGVCVSPLYHSGSGHSQIWGGVSLDRITEHRRQRVGLGWEILNTGNYNAVILHRYPCDTLREVLALGRRMREIIYGPIRTVLLKRFLFDFILPPY